MAFSKITRIILYIVAGISLFVVLFFYMSPATVNVDEMEMRVTEAANPVDMTPVAPLPVVDSTATDSTATDSTATDSTAVAEEAPVDVVTVTTPALEAKSPSEVLSGWEFLVWLRTDIILVWAYILVLLALLAAIVFPMLAVFSNTKALIRLALVLAGTAVILVVAYLMSSGTPLEIIGYEGTDNSNPATLKFVDTIIFVTYMLTGLAIGSILYSMISKAFK